MIGYYRAVFVLVIGVTGGVGTGKSTVARMIARRLRGTVLDADSITHELMRPGSPVSRRIRAEFGDQAFTPSGAVDRKRLGRIAFGSKARMKRLSAIIHPEVRRRIQAQLSRMRPDGVGVLDIPLLIESGGAYRVDFLVAVSAPLKQTARRLKARSGWGLQEVRRRQSFQMPLARKEKEAGFVIQNRGTLADTRRQVAALCRQIKKKKEKE